MTDAGKVRRLLAITLLVLVAADVHSQAPALANLFAKDGEIILRRGRSSGGPRHLSNIHIELQGDTATAQSRFTLLSVGDDNVTRLGGSGRYKDDLVRENGAWKIRKRVIFRDLPLDLEGANPVKE